DMRNGLEQQALAVQCGHWPLMRYNPVLREQGENPFTLDSLRPTLSLHEYRQHETRYQALMNQHPEEAQRLLDIAQRVTNQKWADYENMATFPATAFHPDARR
ncbi:MAG: hypothetical protein ACRC5A_07260, partial [Enterobacteriaceae bacterium]